MSNLKHLTVNQLLAEKSACENYINNLSGKLSGQKERLKWIDKYIFEKTPVEMSIAEIEVQLGHKVIIKGEY